MGEPHINLPAPSATLNACGLTCGSLETLMASRLRALAPGEVLEIRSDQHEAADGVSARARLSGNALVTVEEDWSSRCARYFVQKKTPQT
jgi:TusA-related sulfurtransferase